MQKTILMDSKSMIRKVLSGLAQHELRLNIDCMEDVVYYQDQQCLMVPYCWLLNCSYFP